MPKLNVTQNHNLPAEEAKKKLDELNARLADKYGLKSSWKTGVQAPEADISATGVKGTIRVQPTQIVVDLDLSFAMGMMKGTIESRIRDELKSLFEGAPA